MSETIVVHHRRIYLQDITTAFCVRCKTVLDIYSWRYSYNDMGYLEYYVLCVNRLSCTACRIWFHVPPTLLVLWLGRILTCLKNLACAGCDPAAIFICLKSNMIISMCFSSHFHHNPGQGPCDFSKSWPALFLTLVFSLTQVPRQASLHRTRRLPMPKKSFPHAAAAIASQALWVFAIKARRAT